MGDVIAAAAQRSIATGTFVDTVDNAIERKEAGIRYLSYSLDMGIFYEACRAIVSATGGTQH